MGCDIHIFAERRNTETKKWEMNKEDIFPDGDTRKTNTPFDRRSYGLFSFLAGVRNNAGCEPISETKGLPDDSEYLNTKLDKPSRFSYGYFDNGIAYTKKEEREKDADYHSHSFVTLKELLDFDYEKTFEDRRVNKALKSADGSFFMTGAAMQEKAKEGEGEMKTYREFLGEFFFEELELMKTLGEPEDVRVVFYFDN